MTKALIAFGSTTGNTAEVAQWIADHLGKAGIEATAKDCAGESASELCAGYDLIVLGCPTYGDDPIEVQEDFEPILDSLEKTGIGGKKVAVFGCGDSSYTHFCGAVDVIEERVRSCSGTLIVGSLKVDTPYDGYRKEVEEWSGKVAAAA